MKIPVGTRKSPLALTQVEEILHEIRVFYPAITFETIALETTGDIDQKTSLRDLDKTDFFTRELDAMLLSGQCRIAIHSAKDLPDPIPEGLSLVALTHGVNPSDSLVLREGEHLNTLPSGGVIATSSVRREETVKRLRSDLKFVDIRGNIQQRLERLFSREVDGVVIAEAALIRLGLTHLNRTTLPGDTVPLQGKLAVLARKEDHEMKNLFSHLAAS